MHRTGPPLSWALPHFWCRVLFFNTPPPDVLHFVIFRHFVAPALSADRAWLVPTSYASDISPGLPALQFDRCSIGSVTLRSRPHHLDSIQRQSRPSLDSALAW